MVPDQPTARVPLTLMRVPSPQGVILRCRGNLTVGGVEALRRNLALMTTSAPSMLIVNVSAVRELDASGARALEETGLSLAASGGALVVVAPEDKAAYLRAQWGAGLELTICNSEADAIALVAARRATPAAGAVPPA